MAKVCLDYGHGGKDSGAVGNGFKEKDITLEIGSKTVKILERHNVEVVQTRTTDVFIELEDRADRANQAKADIFVSLHCNSFSDSQAQGVEVYAYPNSDKGKDLSQAILDHIIKDNLYTQNRGLKTAKFAVLRLTKMPATLVELGFITNPEDIEILTNKQDELALAVAKGILAYLGIEYKQISVSDPEEGPYQRAINTLAAHNIINSIELWEDPSKIKPSHARDLVIKVAAYID